MGVDGAPRGMIGAAPARTWRGARATSTGFAARPRTCVQVRTRASGVRRTGATRARYSARMASVGTSVARKEGMDRATGAAMYADDLRFPGMLVGRTIRSTIPRGRITGIALDFDTTGFTVVDHR